MSKLLLISLLISSATRAEKILKFESEYVVPVTNETLEPMATFILSEYTVAIPDQGLPRLSFRLPEELLGKESELLVFQLIEDAPPMKKLQGDFGSAQCLGKWPELQCDFDFDNLDFSSVTLLQFANLFPFNEAFSRFRVAKSFKSDPIGKSRVLRPIP